MTWVRSSNQVIDLSPLSGLTALAWQKMDTDWQFDIEYTFLHRSIIERLIIRMGETYSGTAWRNGIFYDTENGQLLLECTYTNRETSNQGKLTFHLRGQSLEELLLITRTTADWHDFQIGNHTALLTDGKPLAKWEDKDEFWADV